MATYGDDPAYQGWLATLGFLEPEAKRRASDAEGRILEAADFTREGLGIDRDQALEGIGANFENRGLVRSGEHERRRAESLRDSNRRFGALELQTANQLASNSDSLVRELADYQMRDAGYRYDAASRSGNKAGGG